MKKPYLLCIFVYIFNFTTSAKAVVIDFESTTSGDIVANQLVFADAAFTASNGLSLIADSGNQSICAGFVFQGNSVTCAGDLTVDFTTAANNLSFETLFHDAGDQIKIDVFDVGGLLGSVTSSGDTTVDLSGFANVTSIDILYDGTDGFGYAFDNFTFHVVPIPAAIWLFGSGLLGLIGFARKRAA